MALEPPATQQKPQHRFRSRDWFDDPKHIDMVAIYLERFMNYGLTANELLSGKPIVGIVQSGSDINPCNRIHVETVKRVRDGVRDAGGIPMDALMSLPTLGDGRQSGTSDSPSILNCSPESAAGGGLAWLRTGDTVRIDLVAGSCNALVSDAEIAGRKTEPPPPIPESATPWQELYRSTVSQLDSGGVMELAVKYRGVAQKTPRHNH